MNRVTILYAPEKHGELVGKVAAAFRKLSLDVTALPAGNGGIPDITPADIVVFASGFEGGGSLHPDFGEMVRAFAGINLAGRLAGFLDLDGGSAPALFRKALGDTGIAVFQRDLVLGGDRAKTTGLERTIAEWVEALTTKYRNGLHE